MVLASCSTYVQIVQGAPGNKQILKIEDCNVFDNDTVRIVYSFWAERGIMSFIFYNKMQAPFYIVRKKSSYADNNHNYDYYCYVDEETNAISHTHDSHMPPGSIFGNFITNSTKDNFETEHYINHHFYDKRMITARHVHLTECPVCDALEIQHYLQDPVCITLLNSA